MLEPLGAIFVRIGLLERWRPDINRALYVMSRDIIEANRIELVPVEQLQAGFELSPRRVEPRICRIKRELFRIEGGHAGIETAIVKRLSQSKAWSNRYAGYSLERHSDFRLEVKSLNRRRSYQRHVSVDRLLAL